MKRGLTSVATIALASMAFASSSAGEAGMSEAAAERLASFEQTGETTSCLSLSSIRSIKALDDSHFLVTTRANEHYLNRTSSQCNGAHRPNHRIQYSVPQNRLCRMEIITVVNNSGGFSTGSCSLGDFERLQDKAGDEA